MISLMSSTLKYSHRRKYRMSTTVLPEASPDQDSVSCLFKMGWLQKQRIGIHCLSLFLLHLKDNTTMLSNIGSDWYKFLLEECIVLLFLDWNHNRRMFRHSFMTQKWCNGSFPQSPRSYLCHLLCLASSLIVCSNSLRGRGVAELPHPSPKALLNLTLILLEANRQEEKKLRPLRYHYFKFL